MGSDESFSVTGQFGCKLSTIIEKVKAIAEDERVLIFVQFPDLMSKVEEALTVNGIKVLKYHGRLVTCPGACHDACLAHVCECLRRC